MAPHPTVMNVPGWGAWSFDPIVAIILAAAVVVYVRMFRRASAKAATPPNASHWLPYGMGISLIVVALFSPLDTIGDRYLLSAHTMQHVLLSDLAPALIVLGLRSPILPLGLSRRALRAIAPGAHTKTSRLLAIATSPWVALPLWAIATWVWALPSVFDYTATHAFLHVFEHATLFYTGLALWWLIIDPLPSARQRPNGERLAFLGFSRLASAFVCVPLTWLATTEYPLYAGAPRGYGLSPIADQHLAGASMCFVEIAVFGLAFVIAFISMLSRSEARMALLDSTGAPREQF